MSNDKILVINKVRPEYTQYVKISDAKQYFFGTRLTDFAVLFSNGTLIEELNSQEMKKIIPSLEKPDDKEAYFNTLLTLPVGSEFFVDGEKFILRSSGFGSFYLADVNNSYLNGVNFYVKSLTNTSAIYTRQELVDMLVSQRYRIAK